MDFYSFWPIEPPQKRFRNHCSLKLASLKKCSEKKAFRGINKEIRDSMQRDLTFWVTKTALGSILAACTLWLRTCLRTLGQQTKKLAVMPPQTGHSCD